MMNGSSGVLPLRAFAAGRHVRRAPSCCRSWRACQRGHTKGHSGYAPDVSGKHSAALHSQGFDHKPGHGSAGILLLSCNEVAVAHGVGFEATRNDEVGSGKLLRLVFNPKRLNTVADKFIGEALG